MKPFSASGVSESTQPHPKVAIPGAKRGRVIIVRPISMGMDGTQNDLDKPPIPKGKGERSHVAGKIKIDFFVSFVAHIVAHTLRNRLIYLPWDKS